MGGDDGAAEDDAGFVCDDFNEAVGEVGGVTAGDLAEGDDSFEVFDVAFDGVVFHESDRGDDGEGVGDFGHDGIVDGLFGAVGEVVAGDLAVVDGAVGGTVLVAGDVASGENVLGGGLEVFVDFDAVFVVVDVGVLEADVGGGYTTGGNKDFVDAD